MSCNHNITRFSITHTKYDCDLYITITHLSVCNRTLRKLQSDSVYAEVANTCKQTVFCNHTVNEVESHS
jgi:hypothetical protein